MIAESKPCVVQSDEGTTTGEAAWVAQVLAKGGDPIPQMKPARTLLDSVGGLGGLLQATPQQLVAVGFLDGQQVALLTAMQRVAGSSPAAEPPVIGSYRALEYFLRTRGIGADVAMTRALLLGEYHCLRADVILANGGSLLSFEQRRELVQSCLEHRASAAILARSVDSITPSMVDSTREANVVACSLEMLGMRLLDYVLVAPSEIRRVRWHQSCASAPTSLMS